MDLTRYWYVVRDQWVFFLIGFVLTAVLATTFAVRQPDVYQATGTFVVRPRVIEGSEVVRAIDALNRSVEIGSTYAFIAESDLIEDRARERVDVGSGVRVGAELVPGTNVVEISAFGGDAEGVASMAEAIGTETVAYIANLQDAFELVPLDAAGIPSRPAGPNRGLTIVLGGMFGMGVGALLAIAAQFAKEWRRRPSRDEVTDPYTGVYSEAYFQARFRQEVLRAKRRRQVFTLGLFRMVADHKTHEAVPTQTILRQTAMVLQGKMDDDELLAYLGDGIFALLLHEPDVSRAEWQLKQWQKEIETMDFASSVSPVTIRVSVGVGSYGHADVAAVDPEEAASGLL